MQVTTLGLDLVKSVVPVHGVDAKGHVVLCKRFSRTKVLPFLAQLRRASLGAQPRAAPIIGRASCRSRDIPYTAGGPYMRHSRQPHRRAANDAILVPAAGDCEHEPSARPPLVEPEHVYLRKDTLW